MLKRNALIRLIGGLCFGGVCLMPFGSHAGEGSESDGRCALSTLQQQVESQARDDPEFPLETVIDRLAIRTSMTMFSGAGGDAAGDQDVPATRPEGVSEVEWQALQSSGLARGDFGNGTTYTLLDLDEDGRRDLIADFDAGGTGLWSYVRVLRRLGGRFVAPLVDSTADVPEASSFYSINGRGANQSGDWIRLCGRVYLAYRDSVYGLDRVELLRAFPTEPEVPVLNVRYRYTLSVPVAQPSPVSRKIERLDGALLAALNQALTQVDREVARDVGDPSVSICPIPRDADKQADDYSSFGPGHYSYEIVGDMPVWFAGQCHIGRVVDWFGAYRKSVGLDALIWTRLPGGDEQGEYQLRGTRRVIGVEAAMAAVRVNGMASD